MADPVITEMHSKGGRPRSLLSPEEKKEKYRASARALRDAKKLAATPSPPTEADIATLAAANAGPAVAPAIVIAIAKAVADLSVQDATFVTALCSGKSGGDAYVAAYPGTNPNTARTHASSKLQSHPALRKAIENVKLALAMAVAYDFSAFMREMDEAMAFAKVTKNATAFVRAVELRGKATGTLSDKPSAGAGTGFTLVIGGIAEPAFAERAE